MKLKDEILNDDIVEQGGNVAQFVSFAPDGSQRFCRIRGADPDLKFINLESAIFSLLKRTEFVNIRSFLPDKPDGNPFFMGRKGFETVEKIEAKVRELQSQGFYTIINEEIDIGDGGFSGVLLGNAAEFATRDIPRCVEKPGCATLPRLKALEFARILYSHRINIPYDRSHRVEFSIHPGPVGYRREHQIIWQVEKTDGSSIVPEPRPIWPNRVSKDIGDKAFGLLIASLYGFRVPRTQVVGRIIPPFTFGEETGSPETCWRRTCPITQQPGLYTTKLGQIDPFELMQKEDPDGTKIAAIIFQDDVQAAYSGAAITDANGKIIIEGKRGRGDDFMIGAGGPVKLPDHISDAVSNVWEKGCAEFGSVRFEWCYDTLGSLWTMQFHVGQSVSTGDLIYPGQPEKFEVFDVTLGLDKLREFADQAKEKDFGIILKGNVGITSHFGDHLRRRMIPSRLERE